jgi:hypothetical protein
MAHIADGTVEVVGHGFHQYRHAADAVAFIGQFIKLFVVIATRATLAMARLMTSRVMLAVRALATMARKRGLSSSTGATHAGHGDDFTNVLGKDLAFDRILTVFAVLDVGPFAVSGMTLLFSS